MSVDVLNETDYRLDEIELVALARYVMEQMRVHPGADLCIRLVDEDAMEVLHVQWMDLPGPTDVIYVTGSGGAFSQQGAMVLGSEATV